MQTNDSLSTNLQTANQQPRLPVREERQRRQNAAREVLIAGNALAEEDRLREQTMAPQQDPVRLRCVQRRSWNRQ